jgi:hypothetical protein
MQVMRRMTAVLVLAGLLIVATTAGCSSDSKDDASPGTGAEKGAVASETTSTTAAKTTTTTLGPPPPPGSIPFVDPFTSSTGTDPAGSGCTPQSSSLPDGKWFGQLKAVDTTAGTVGLDLECLFVGDAANVAAAADGQTEIPVANDHYIRNENDTVRTQPAVSEVAVGVLGAGGNATAYEATASGLSSAGVLIDHPVWLQVQDGWVIAIQEQFFP